MCGYEEPNNTELVSQFMKSLICRGTNAMRCRVITMVTTLEPRVAQKDALNNLSKEFVTSMKEMD